MSRYLCFDIDRGIPVIDYTMVPCFDRELSDLEKQEKLIKTIVLIAIVYACIFKIANRQMKVQPLVVGTGNADLINVEGIPRIDAEQDS